MFETDACKTEGRDTRHVQGSRDSHWGQEGHTRAPNVPLGFSLFMTESQNTDAPVVRGPADSPGYFVHNQGDAHRVFVAPNFSRRRDAHYDVVFGRTMSKR